MIFQQFLGYGLDGFAHATEALVGNAMGAGDRLAARRAIRAATWLAIMVAGLYTIVYLLLGPPIVALLTDLEAVRRQASAHLFWVYLSPLVSVWAYQLDGIFIGTTRAKEMRNGMLIALIVFVVAVWGCPRILAVFDVYRAQTHGLWLAFLVFMATRAVTLGFWLPRAEFAHFGLAKGLRTACYRGFALFGASIGRLHGKKLNAGLDSLTGLIIYVIPTKKGDHSVDMKSALSDVIHRFLKPILQSVGVLLGYLMRLREVALAGTVSAVIFTSGLGAFALYTPEQILRDDPQHGLLGAATKNFATDNDAELDSFIQVVALSRWEGMTTAAPMQGVDPAPLVLAAYTPTVAYAEESSVVVERGDNLFGVLTRAGVLTNHAEQVIQSLGDLYDTRKDLRAGQELSLIFDQELEFRGAEGRQLASLILPVSFDRHIIVTRAGGDDGFAAEEVVKEFVRRTSRGAGFIDSSLFEDGAKAGLPQGTLADLIQLYSFDVRFPARSAARRCVRSYL